MDVWHTAREAELATPHGWLSLTSLNWLGPPPLRWTAYGAVECLDPDGVVLTASAAEGLVVRSVREPRPVDGTVTLHPVDGKPGTLIEDGDRLIEVARRTDAHVLRVRDPQAPPGPGSPASRPSTSTGAGCSTRCSSPTFNRGRSRSARSSRASRTSRRRSATSCSASRGSGSVSSRCTGKDGGLSLHFRDTTSGKSTYAGGRILFTGEPTPEGELTVDFNRTGQPAARPRPTLRARCRPRATT